jgi:hypothetical protein
VVLRLGLQQDNRAASAFKLASEGEPRLIEFILKSYRGEIYRERSEVGIVGSSIASAIWAVPKGVRAAGNEEEF